MAEIVNAQAARFCNEKARRIADLIIQLDRTLPQFALDVVRDFENVTGAAQNKDVVVDGSANDGRPSVAKENVAELKFVCEQLAAVMNTSDYRALVNKWAINKQPIF